MRAQPHFKLTRQATLALMVSAAFTAAAGAAPVAQVEFTSGPVTVAGPGAKPRVVGKGSVLESGETIETGVNGRAQLRFTDGAYMSLQPQTAFRVDDYRFDGKTDGQEKGFFSLLKGGLRTVTGVIGRTNKSTYQVTTATATIGIRGTEYLLNVENSTTLHVGGGTGQLTPKGGPARTFLVPERSTLFHPSATATPVFTHQPPILSPAPAAVHAKQGSQPTPPPGQTDSQQTDAVIAPPAVDVLIGNQVGSSGSALIVGGAGGGGLFGGIPSGPVAFNFSIGGEGNFCQIGCINSGSGSQCGRADVNFTGSSISFTQGTFYVGDFIESGPMTISRGTADFSGMSIGNVAAIGVLKNGTVSVQGTFINDFILGSNEGAHGFLYIPTPNMPNSMSATYTFVGATPATFSNNIGGSGLVPGGMVTGGTMTANFAPSPSVSGNAQYLFVGANLYNLNFSGSISGAGFTGGGSFSRTSGPATACTPSPCSAQVNGGFAGTANPTPPFAGYVVKVFAPGYSINNAILMAR